MLTSDFGEFEERSAFESCVLYFGMCKEEICEIIIVWNFYWGFHG